MPAQAIMDRSGPEMEGMGNPYQTVNGPLAQTIPLQPGMAWKPAAAGKAGPGKQLRLTVVRGDANRPPYEVNLTDRLVIGRAADCDVALTDDKEVSRNHCELTLEGEVIRIADLGSKNGTLVNGVPISGSYQLQNDDIILVGKTEMRVTLV